MNRFTGQKDVDIKILNLLEDKDLIALCETNKYINSICTNDFFWRDRIILKYGKDILNAVKSNSYRELYTSGKIKTYLLCLEINKLPYHSQLVIDDFYNSHDGFVSAHFIKDPDMLTYLLLKIVLTRVISFPKRDLSYEEKLKEVILIVYNQIIPYRTDELDITKDFLTEKERRIFMRLISVKTSKDEILKITNFYFPQRIKLLSPHPEHKFALLAYIHKGFQSGKIPLDILWEELCTLPYILDFNEKDEL